MNVLLNVVDDDVVDDDDVDDDINSKNSKNEQTVIPFIERVVVIFVSDRTAIKHT